MRAALPADPARSGGFGGLAWIAVAFLAYVLMLQRLWFDAPISDDFAIVFRDGMGMMDARSAREWLGIALAQHNEHRVAVMRIVAWAMGEAGHIDFRALVLIGNLAVLGIAVLAWAEFRQAVAAPLFAAAALVTFQWSYYEATLMASAALPNIGVIFFSFACLYFALRGGGIATALCIVFGIVAVGSQANGLFALPLAAIGCALTARRGRAALLAAVAVALWAAYFWQYGRPLHHPSLTAALADPVSGARFFFIVIGGIVPGRWLPVGVGVAILAAFAWLTRRGAWKAHPTAALWIAFVLLSAAAATVGRLGLGLDQARSSRYAIYSTVLVVIAFLSVCAVTRPWSRRTCVVAVVAAALVNAGVSWAAWRDARAFSIAGRLLAKSVPASPEVLAERYLWILNPDVAEATRLLVAVEQRGLYAPREETIHPTVLRSIAAPPATARVAGSLDEARAAGKRVIVQGWTEIPAIVAGRTLSIFPDHGNPTFARFEVTGRPDAAMLGGDARLLSSGFRMELEYPSEEAARTAAASLRVMAEAPGHAPAILAR